MKIVQINFSCMWGSTGKICNSISNILSQKSIENYTFYIFGENLEKKNNYIRYGNFPYTKFQALKAKLFGNYGFNSNIATKYLLKKLDDIKPDIVHVHNIHGHDCNFELLFNYLKEKRIKVYYTFHDCWAFTGYCPHFVVAKCDNWLTGCRNCPIKKRFSWFADNSKKNYLRKKTALSGLDMTIITPSEWLADIVKKSFLKDYPVKVINNGIDLAVFKPTETDFRTKYRLDNKKIVLGVAFGWGYAKGLDVFIELSNRLSDDYQVVLVGTDNNIDKHLPKNILSIHRTHSQQELAEIYSAADVFVNPTREENYPTVNMESLACGTPVLTFRTGGSSEILDETCGSVVECDDVDSFENELIRICTDEPYTKQACLKKSKEFDMNNRFNEYIELYKNFNEET